MLIILALKFENAHLNKRTWRKTSYVTLSGFPVGQARVLFKTKHGTCAVKAGR